MFILLILRVSCFREIFKDKYPGKKIIGFSWRGGSAATRKFSRNIELDVWAEFFIREDCQFVNLQYDTTDSERKKLEAMGVVTPDFNLKDDIDEMASCLQSLDLLISMDNTTVHLAGALGTKVWNIIPFSAEWRWFMEDEKSFWYKSMRLFRNKELSSWDECLSHVVSELDGFD